MTDASTAVVNIKPQPTEAVTGNAGINSRKRTGEQAGEASDREGRTFADALEDVRDKTTDESGGKKTAKKSDGTVSGRRHAAGKAKNRKTADGVARPAVGIKEDSDTKILDSLRKNLNLPSGDEDDTEVKADSRQAVEATAAAGGRPISPAAAEVIAACGHMAGDNEATAGGLMNKKPAAEVATAARGKKDSAVGKTGKAVLQNVGMEISAEDAERENGLTSRSGRVEVVDNRDFSRMVDAKQVDRSASTADRAENAGGNDAGTARNVNVAVAETEIDLSPSGGKTGSVRSAAAELARKLDGQAGNEVVRQVKVVLDRADAGEVRINLRPDNMGRVRVRIRMEDNRLTGRIFVETAAARDAFRNALDGLQTKLVESGFGAADLELAFEDSSGSFADGGDRNNRQAADSGRAAREFENMVTTTVVDEAADTRVNLVV